MDSEDLQSIGNNVKSQNLFLKEEDDLVEEVSQWQSFSNAVRDSVFGLFFLASKESGVLGWWAATSTGTLKRFYFSVFNCRAWLYLAYSLLAWFFEFDFFVGSHVCFFD